MNIKSSHSQSVAPPPADPLSPYLPASLVIRCRRRPVVLLVMLILAYGLVVLPANGNRTGYSATAERLDV